LIRSLLNAEYWTRTASSWRSNSRYRSVCSGLYERACCRLSGASSNVTLFDIQLPSARN